MESKLSVRRTTLLRRGRVSIPKSRYFITLCTKNRVKSLTIQPSADRLFSQLESQERDGDFQLHCGTLMPDHLHLVLRIGEKLPFSKTIAKLKAKTREPIDWQKNFYDHRIRSDETEEEYARYVFMNPYRSGICKLDCSYPLWRRWRETPYSFEESLSTHGSIPNEWIH